MAFFCFGLNLSEPRSFGRLIRALYGRLPLPPCRQVLVVRSLSRRLQLGLEEHLDCVNGALQVDLAIGVGDPHSFLSDLLHQAVGFVKDPARKEADQAGLDVLTQVLQVVAETKKS